VLLLVVLSLLVLFTLIAVTFVLVASQSRRSVRADSRNEQYGDDPQKQLDSVFAQLVRDTVNPQSALRGHSLLADIYGNDGLRFTCTTTPVVFNPLGGGQFITLQMTPDTVLSTNYPALPPTNVPQPSCPLTTTQIQTPGFFNGCVLTLADGPGADKSARIVGWTISGGVYTATVLAFDGVTFAALSAGTTRGVLVNGRPFNGTGFGFDPTGLPAAQTLLTNSTQFSPPVGAPIQVPVVELPNPVFSAGFLPAALIGGTDEDYDAPDLQNMILAYTPVTFLPYVAPPNISPIIPSFHRGDLIEFFRQSGQIGGAYQPIWSDPTQRASMLRQALLRPFGPMTINGNALGIAPDHPNFTGSNPGTPTNPLFDAVNGPWDIDNDGDGIPDSVWVDVGLPVQTAPDGRRFKPLAAVLAVDLDGRLNVNAHGNIGHYDINPALNAPPGAADGYYFAGGPPPLNLPRGQGYGPAEVRLDAVGSGGPIFDPTTARKLLAARYQEPNSTLSTFPPVYDSRNPPVRY
jgi:hypothetical protein